MEFNRFTPVTLRGHRGESEVISADEEEPRGNYGNSHALLRYRTRGGDQKLKEHILSSKANATYQAASIQNELISIAGSLGREKVVKQTRK